MSLKLKYLRSLIYLVGYLFPRGKNSGVVLKDIRYRSSDGKEKEDYSSTGEGQKTGAEEVLNKYIRI